MRVPQLIRSDIAASAIAHVSVLALVILFSEVHPFGRVTAEPIAVDIVTPQQVPEQKSEPPEPPQKREPDFSALAKPAASKPAASEPAASEPAASETAASDSAPAAPPQQQQAALSPPQQGQRAAPDQVQAAPPQAPSPSPAPYQPPEPDLTLKYHVMLGLPEYSPPAVPADASDKPGDGGDATASSAADVESSVIAEFRRHLKTCSKLPADVARADNVMIKLRAVMTMDGRLATAPILIEATASAKGPVLMQSAIKALQACQPYTMLPKDRYGEWKVIDLTFTPQDFSS